MMGAIWIGRLMHARLQPATHRFSYGLYWLSINLNTLHELNQQIIGFSYNRWNLWSIYDRDYLGSDPMPIADKAIDLARASGIADPVTDIELLTSPRFLGCQFNPVNLFLLSNGTQTVAVIAEVSNTFGETHVYVIPHPTVTDGVIHAAHKKAFYVSPFNDLTGEYRYRITQRPETTLGVSINLFRDGEPWVISQFNGKRREWRSVNVWLTVFQFPLVGLMTLLRIGWQAIRIRRKGVMPLLKPKPVDPHTYRRAGQQSLAQLISHLRSFK